MCRLAPPVLAVLLLSGCAAERVPGDGRLLVLQALPAAFAEYDLTWEHGPLPLVSETGDEAERAVLEARCDAIIDAWSEKLRTTSYAHMTRTTERAVIASRRPLLLLGRPHPHVVERSCARAEIYMGPESFWTAGWICHPDGRFAASTPNMKLLYENGIVVERAYDVASQGYTTTFAAPAHPWGADDFHAMGYWHGCMIGDCAQTWLGESRMRDFTIERLAECLLLPETRDFGGIKCHVLRWEVGDDTWRMRHDYYFNAEGVKVGRDARQWSKGTLEESYIIERSTNVWTFFDDVPPQLDGHRAFLMKGLDEGEIATAARSQPSAGNRAPDVEITFLDGAVTMLGSILANGPVVIDFWATWCGPCRLTMPVVDRIAADFAKHGVQVIAIAVNDEERRVRRYIAENAPSVRAAVDARGAIAAAFQVQSLPRIVVIDRCGTVRAVHSGAAEDLDERLRQQLRELLGPRVEQRAAR